MYLQLCAFLISGLVILCSPQSILPSLPQATASTLPLTGVNLGIFAADQGAASRPTVPVQTPAPVPATTATPNATLNATSSPPVPFLSPSQWWQQGQDAIAELRGSLADLVPWFLAVAKGAPAPTATPTPTAVPAATPLTNATPNATPSPPVPFLSPSQWWQLGQDAIAELRGSLANLVPWFLAVAKGTPAPTATPTPTAAPTATPNATPNATPPLPVLPASATVAVVAVGPGRPRSTAREVGRTRTVVHIGGQGRTGANRNSNPDCDTNRNT